ncbi:MAG TPA: M48 family metalloprotease [Burkholderiales bacterium]|nr:M48 family metalloprotease [Burkholderiales bacterium]
MRISVRRPILLAAAAAAAALAAACASNPATGGADVVTMSEKKEIEIGREMHPKVLQQYGRYNDERLQAYVNEIGQRLAAKGERPGITWTFTVLDSEETNAFALPGGYIYITRGIMSYLNSEAELAAVLGHEIGHVTARHAVRQQAGATAAGVGATLIGILTGSGGLANIASVGSQALIAGYGRDMELEADELGARYISNVGYDSDSMIDVVRLLKNQEMFEIQRAREEGREPRVYHGVFASHPDNDTRLKEVVASAGKVTADEKRPDNRDLYLSRITGLPVGPSEAQGVTRGTRFYHLDMGFTVAFPSGWLVQNQPAKLVSATPQKDTTLQLYTMPYPPSMTPEQFLTRNLQGTRVEKGEALTVNGLPAYTAIAQNVALPWGNKGPARYAVIYMNNLAYVFFGASRITSALPAKDPLMMSSIKTFRRMRQQEVETADPDRIRVVRATPQTTIEGLAKTSAIEKYAAQRLRLLNDLYPDKEPTPGQAIKIVE